MRLHRRQPTRLPCPWDSPGKNTGVGCHFLLQFDNTGRAFISNSEMWSKGEQSWKDPLFHTEKNFLRRVQGLKERVLHYVLSHRFIMFLLSRKQTALLILFLYTYMEKLEKAMAPHPSTLAWKIPWMEEPGRLQSMGSLRVRHDWGTSLSLSTVMHWRRK